jgi:glycosyltransferase involved in cell wall biosynthesis
VKIHVVIPAYKVESQILALLPRIGKTVSKIWVVDDACPNGSGQLVAEKSKDERVRVLFHEENKGVGGAVITGYLAAIEAGAEIVVKIDGDGQMHPEDLPELVAPILAGRADYSKGNRFDSIEGLRVMPKIRILGNAGLSLISKLSSGYWSVNDPTNGYTAAHVKSLNRVGLHKLSNRYFFESDLLYRLNLVGAVVEDVPLPARYGDEKSNLKVGKVLFEFPYRHFKNYWKRIAYRFFLREWSVGSVELVAGLALTIYGLFFGLSSFFAAVSRDEATSAGQVTIASLAVILGFQLLLSFVSYDIQTEPRNPLQGR